MFIHLQYSRPLTLVKEKIQTRFKRSKEKGKKTVLADSPLTLPLSPGLIAEESSGSNLFSNQLSPCNYTLSAPSASATGHSPAQHHVNAGECKQQREEFVYADATYKQPEGRVEIRPSITATTIAAPPHHVTHDGTGQVTHAELSKDTNMTITPHASTCSAFSPSASSNSSSLEQSPSQEATTNSPLH